ncbi:tRNA splicing endonuclease SEN2 [Methanonatronarchaeum thermophilum]|uniref:tRNA splicing endonuclease SEN2 n=1 Tax=Methanonatronarchaeum thermophilum TaxID=1927129 RepID=A0A1Y3GAD2_9EURY|nr:tRNA-intron lyase [Methanonatronarchaeum thermophilum]OUJ18379.1 tRNA splicing endonuclease SEN2 [Methanonatronarchaeum thermophilum]
MPEINENGVQIQNQNKIKDLQESYYGKITNNTLLLNHIEAAYLTEKNKLKLNKEKLIETASKHTPRFELKFIVYRDLRERGLFMKQGGESADLFLYDRGKKPDKHQFKYLVHIYSEKDKININWILKRTKKSENLRKKTLLALVDGEGDITYYQTKKTNPKGTAKQIKNTQARGTLLEERTLLWKNGEKLYNKYFYGKPFSGNIYQLSLTETQYLKDKKHLKLKTNNKKIKQKTADPKRFTKKYQVYKDLRERGLIPKTGFKFGTDYRVYKKYKNPNNLSHAEYLVHTTDKKTELHPPELSGTVRLTQNVRKKILFAVVDRKINYIEIERIKL